MNDKIQLTKAFNDFKRLFNLKDIRVSFWCAGDVAYHIRSRPYLEVITNDGKCIDLMIADPYYKFDYAYVDEFNKLKYIPDSPFGETPVPIQAWQIAKSLFNIAQQSPVYLFMPNVDPYYCDENQHIFLNKGVQLNEFLVYADLNTQHGC